jgi:hypothetical protein
MMKSALVILAVAAFLPASVMSDQKTGLTKGKGNAVEDVGEAIGEAVGEAVEFEATPPVTIKPPPTEGEVPDIQFGEEPETPEPMPPKRKAKGEGKGSWGKGKGSGSGPDIERLTASSSAVGGATVGVGLGLVVLVVGVGVASVRNKVKKTEGYSSLDVVVTADVVDYGTAAV